MEIEKGRTMDRFHRDLLAFRRYVEIDDPHSAPPRRPRKKMPPSSAGSADLSGSTRSLWEFARTLRETHDHGIDLIRDMIDATADSIELPTPARST